jgi:hypothetical protein
MIIDLLHLFIVPSNLSIFWAFLFVCRVDLRMTWTVLWTWLFSPLSLSKMGLALDLFKILNFIIHYFKLASAKECSEAPKRKKVRARGRMANPNTNIRRRNAVYVLLRVVKFFLSAVSCGGRGFWFLIRQKTVKLIRLAVFCLNRDLWN